MDKIVVSLEEFQEELASKCELIQFRLRDFISMLEEEEGRIGNVPVVFWDQWSSVKFANEQNVMCFREGKLYFGGFHMNGDAFGKLK